MIRKIKSRLSVKVFLLMLSLLLLCCFLTYYFILQAAPENYRYDIEDAEWWICFLPEELLRVERDYAYTWLEPTDAELRRFYENEFELHCFQPDGQEVLLQDVTRLSGGHLRDFDTLEKTKAYTVLFSDCDTPYTLLLARNPAIRTQTEEAIQRTLPVLGLTVLFASIASALFCSWYVTAPLQKVSRLSGQMANMDFSGSYPTGRTDEIGVLSASLNTLAQKLKAALSELQEANRTLQTDMDRERLLEQQRTEFFAAASHELKTPITIIKGQLQGMLYQIGRYKDRETYLARSLEVADTLEGMVQNLLTIFRLDTPGYTCQKNSLNLSRLINERIAAFEDLWMQKNLTVVPSISPALYVSGDRQLLQKVLDNLFGNAAAYSEPGNQIYVRLWKEAESIRLTVENTGAHIPDEQLPALFEAFYRVEPSRNRQTGGTGLGLYIVKTILNLHGAGVEIANTPQGVLVSIQFPEAAQNRRA